MTQVFWVKRGNLRWKPVGGTSASKSEFSKNVREMMWHKCSDLSEEIVVTVGEIRTQMFPRWVAYGAGEKF